MWRGEKRLNLVDTVQEVERVLGASPTSATWQRSKGAMALAAFTRRIKRDISRIWAGPWWAPARFVEPRSKGTPTSAMSSPA
jgi:hypothetical protein